MDTLFFSHIPKTAGTSLRLAAIKRFGERRVVSDYGPTRHTSAIVSDLVHEKQDYYAFRQYLEHRRVRLLAAHAPMRYYRRIFPSANIVTFVRDPVERIVSHYHTAVKFQQYPHTLVRFCREEKYQNLQSAYFEQMPPELVGFVGITERYEESLQVLRAQYGHAFVQLTLNRTAHKDRQSSHASQLDDWTVNLIREQNQKDLALYQTCCELFETRLQAYRCYRPHVFGKVKHLDGESVQGWAAPSMDTDPVVLDVSVNGEHYRSVTAGQYVPEMKERNAPRAGYIGFNCRFEQPLSAGDEVICRVRGGSQELRGPRQIAETDFLDRPAVRAG